MAWGKKNKRTKVIPCPYCINGIKKGTSRECDICDGLGNFELREDNRAKDDRS